MEQRQITDSELMEMKGQVEEIYTAMVGNEGMGQKGLIQRIQKMEDDISSMKVLRDRIIIGGGVVAGVLWFLGQVGEKIFDAFIKK